MIFEVSEWHCWTQCDVNEDDIESAETKDWFIEKGLLLMCFVASKECFERSEESLIFNTVVIFEEADHEETWVDKQEI